MLRLKSVGSALIRRPLTQKAGEVKPGRLKRIATALYTPALNTLRDYKDVLLDAGKKVVKKPLKSTLTTLVLSPFVYLWYYNPTFLNFHNTSLNNHHRLLLLSGRIRNKASEEFIDTVKKLEREGRLGYLSLGLCSLVYSTHVNREVCEFGHVFMKPRWTEYLDRVVDVGGMGRWFYMDQAMENYDINEEEWN